ncbi:MAG: Cof-type HAD-IIB family hydrolase [Oscillospiraceae bacterium]
MKILATDLDGTLVNKNNISQQNKTALEMLQSQNNLLVISTGRPYNGVSFLKDDHNISANYYILLNGALILNKNLSKIQHKTIETRILKNILKDCEFNDISISLESGFTTYNLSKVNDSPYCGKVNVNDISEVKDEISLISICMHEKTVDFIDNFKNKINLKYSDSIIAYRNLNYIDIVPKCCSKGNGVKYVMEKELVSKDEIYTIGDSWNDISMFNVTENSFTFKNAEKELQQHAKYLVDSVSECILNYML